MTTARRTTVVQTVPAWVQAGSLADNTDDVSIF